MVRGYFSLMPNSKSGIYCMQYMNMYPKEIEAMIGIDSSVLNQVNYDGISDGLYYLVKFMDITGLTRFSNVFGSDFIKGMESSGGYSEEEIRTATAMILVDNMKKQA